MFGPGTPFEREPFTDSLDYKERRSSTLHAFAPRNLLTDWKKDQGVAGIYSLKSAENRISRIIIDEEGRTVLRMDELNLDGKAVNEHPIFHRLPESLHNNPLTVRLETNVTLDENLKPSRWQIVKSYYIPFPSGPSGWLHYSWEADVANEPGGCFFGKPSTQVSILVPANPMFSKDYGDYNRVQYSYKGIQINNQKLSNLSLELGYQLLPAIFSQLRETGLVEYPSTVGVEEVSNRVTTKIQNVLRNPTSPERI